MEFPKGESDMKKIVAVFNAADENSGISRELAVRGVFKTARDISITFVRANRFFEPGLLKDADLLMISRGPGKDEVDLFSSGAGVTQELYTGAELWTDSNVRAIMDAVEKRGMGLLVLNEAIACGKRDFTDFLDIEPLEANALEPLWGTHINTDHPITQGVGKFMIDLDKQYAAVIKSSETVSLFETTAIHEKRQTVSGWALERGKGRVVGLLPGATAHAYHAPEYANIFWRAAHWAMKMSIPAYPDAENRYYN